MSSVAGRFLGGAARSSRWLEALAAVATAGGVLYGLAIVPPDAVQGDVQRLMYVHVPAAWLAYLAFAVVFISSVAFLWKGRTRWDRVAHASAEIGIFFTALAIVLGALWGRPVWGAWWTWDPRLTTTTILLVIYIGYLAVRRLGESIERRARWAAIVGIVGFVDVPIVHMSVVWWRTLHQEPTVLRLGKPLIEGPMLAALLWNVGAFTLLYASFMLRRMRVRRLEERIELEPLARAIGSPPKTAVGSERS